MFELLSLQSSIFVLPNVPHIVFIRSAITNYTHSSPQYERDYETCAMYITKSFLDNPNSSPDTRCLNWLLPLDWRVSTNITKVASQITFDTNHACGEIVDIPTSTTKYIDRDGFDTDGGCNTGRLIVFALLFDVISFAIYPFWNHHPTNIR